MEFRVLGRVALDTGAGEVAPRGRLGRIFLAMLLSRPDSRLSVDALAEAMWPDEPDPTAVRKLQLHASRLRALLDDSSRLIFEDDGYRLRLRPGELDAQQFDSLVAEAGRVEDPQARSRLSRRALDLWQGSPYASLDDVAPLAEDATRLEELRLDVLETHYAAEIDCGRHAAVTAALADLARRHPLRERLPALLMDALHRSGRQAEALEVYRSARAGIVEELGLEPGPELRAVHAAILGDDRIATPYRPKDEWTPPHQVPIAPARFTGREHQLRALDRAAASGGVIALHGTGGVGKTALAVHWAHRLAEEFSDGQLFVNLRGHGPTDPLTPGAALYALLRAVGVEPSQMPADDDERCHLFRERIAGRRLLILLDNARDSTQIRPLLPGGDHVVVVTSRSQLRDLVTHEGARRIEVDVMSSDEAVAFLEGRLGSLPDLDRGDLVRLAALCGHLPIALAVVAERADRYNRLPLAELTAELSGVTARGGPLDALTAWQDDPSTSVRAVLSWSYDDLDERTARQFRLLGLHPHPSYDTDAAAWLSGEHGRDTTRLLERLVDAHLLTETVPGLYEMHDLVRSCAADLAAADQYADERRAAIERMRAGYRHTAASFRSTFSRPHPWLEPGDLPAGVTPRPFRHPEGAFSWFRENLRRITSVVTDAAEDEDHRSVAVLVGLFDSALDAVGSLPHWTALNRVALTSALEAGDPADEANALSLSGAVLVREGRPHEARDTLMRAVRIYRSLGDHPGLVVALRRAALALRSMDANQAAVVLLEEALDRQERHGGLLGPIRNNLALALTNLGRTDEAIRVAEQAVRDDEATGGPHDLAHALDTLGLLHLRSGAPHRAIEYFRRAIDQFPDDVVVSHSAGFLRNLGLAQRQVGALAEARASWLRALGVLDRAQVTDSNRVTRHELHELIDSVTG